MGLGNNRDYKTAGQRAKKNLARHAKLTAELMAHGMEREAASVQALAEMEKRRTRLDALFQIYPKAKTP